MTECVAYIEQHARSTLQGQKRTESPAVYGVHEDKTDALQQRRRVRDDEPNPRLGGEDGPLRVGDISPQSAVDAVVSGAQDVRRAGGHSDTLGVWELDAIGTPRFGSPRFSRMLIHGCNID